MLLLQEPWRLRWLPLVLKPWGLQNASGQAKIQVLRSAYLYRSLDLNLSMGRDWSFLSLRFHAQFSCWLYSGWGTRWKVSLVVICPHCLPSKSSWCMHGKCTVTGFADCKWWYKIKNWNKVFLLAEFIYQEQVCDQSSQIHMLKSTSVGIFWKTWWGLTCLNWHCSCCFFVKFQAFAQEVA